MSILAEATDDLTAQLRLAESARPHLESVSAKYDVETHATTLAGGSVVQLAWVAASGTSYEGNNKLDSGSPPSRPWVCCSTHGPTETSSSPG